MTFVPAGFIETNIILGWIFPDEFWKFIMQFKYAVKTLSYKETARCQEQTET